MNFFNKFINKKDLKTVSKGKLYYLASPYTHKDKKIQHKRMKEISKIAGLLIKKNIYGIYPISSSHTIAEEIDMGTSFEHWAEIDYLYIEKSDGLIIANLDGWKKSVGVQAEIEHAKKINKPVYILNTKDLLNNNKLNIKRIA